MMRLIVAGSRNFHNYTLLKYKLRHILQNVKEDIEIVSGGAQGADKLGERFAREYGYRIRIFEADWDTYGKSAGHIRNEQMAGYASHCVCFWDKRSKGTQSMIHFANKYKLPLRVITF